MGFDDGSYNELAFAREVAAAFKTNHRERTVTPALESLFDKLVAEKKAKGYTPSTDGKTFAMTDRAGDVSGLLPQLLNPIEESEVSRYRDDDAWVMEEKHDGRRLMVRVTAGVVEGANRK
jgi:bifunctional non-homologous end joining protein LigD